MAPKHLRHVDAGADLTLRQQLAELKRVPLEQVGRVRMTPDKLPSLVDVCAILTGKSSQHAANDVAQVLRRLFVADNDLRQRVLQVNFGGRGNRGTPVPKDLAALVEIIFLLPGRAAAQVRQAAAQIFVRYLGGDVSLVREVEHLHHVQAFLRENAPEHPIRAFGVAAENSERREGGDVEVIDVGSQKLQLEAGNGGALDTKLGVSPERTAIVKSSVRTTSRKRERLAVEDDATATPTFAEFVKHNTPTCSSSHQKDLTRRAYAKILELAAVEEGCSVGSLCSKLADGTFGMKAKLPNEWEHLAVAAVQHVLAPASSAIPTGDMERDVSGDRSPASQAKKPRVAFVAEAEEHGAAKDSANAMWIGMLTLGGKIFFLDSWENRQGLQLRTTGALFRAGHLPQNLFSANPDEAIVAQLVREGVVARRCDWSSFASPKYDGIYLDLCSGSWAYIAVQLELATARASPGCVLGLTVTERDFNGEPLLLRALSLLEFMLDMGWKPAMHRLRASTLLHRSGASRHQVLTQFWVKG